MLSVSDEVKARLKSDNCEKEFYITIGSTTINSEYIYRNSLNITESVMSDKIELTGCISSCMKVKIRTESGISKSSDFHGTEISASMKVYLVDGTLSNAIPLFKGYIDTADTSDKNCIEFVAYDALYYIGSMKVYNWYNGKVAGYPSWGTSKSISLFTFRCRLFDYIQYSEGIDLPQAEIDLPNDTMKIKKRFKNKDMTLIDLLKGLCQINGCFGIINRSGEFEYRYISAGGSGTLVGAYPSLFYPSTIYPSQPLSRTGNVEIITDYQKLEYSNDVVNPVGSGITMRNNSDDAGVTWDSATGATTDWVDDTTDDALIDDDTVVTDNTYVLEGNMFAYKIKKANKKIAIANIYAKIGSDTYFRNFESKAYGLPYVECGDKVIFQRPNGTELEVIITKRVLSGDQYMIDVYSAACATSAEEYVASSQSSVNSMTSAVTSDGASDIAKETVATGNYLYVVSWDASTGVLETKSGANDG